MAPKNNPVQDRYNPPGNMSLDFDYSHEWISLCCWLNLCTAYPYPYIVPCRITHSLSLVSVCPTAYNEGVKREKEVLR